MKLLVATITIILLFGQIAFGDTTHRDWNIVPKERPDHWLDREDIDKSISLLIEPCIKHPLKDNISRATFSSNVNVIADIYVTPPSLMLSIIRRESFFIANQRDKKGAYGLMQVHYGTARVLGCNQTTQYGQIDCGARMLRHCADKCGTWPGALSCYITKSGKCSVQRRTRAAWVLKDRFSIANKLIVAARKRQKSSFRSLLSFVFQPIHLLNRG